ncbi:kinase-like domain-containing protein [Boeremia exigua]|uniref:kinase-like domain-containing protein n=1 Tax=Boeremia exigua TaxID=749465 RepID=UPI001E8E359F|nr:kinase-like domain-containing protein [Boeremia exigua]KAH6633695.1 kinase-like domain-containing protein [Boeremia exigua]
MTRAKNIAPHKIDKSIWHLQDSDRILKRGPNIKLSEAEALQFVALSTHVPVPKVFGAYEKDGLGHIFMSRVHGVPLYDVLHVLNETQVERLTAQLSEYVGSWMAQRGDFFGSMGFKPCRDIFFQHLPAANMPEQDYGPFRTRAEYCNGLVAALVNSRPAGHLDAKDARLVERLQRLGDGRAAPGGGCAVFCHGDLHPDNIFVDHDHVTVVAIVDMGVSGFSIPEREYFEAKSRARNPVWSAMIDRAVPKIPDATYALLSELERELVRYSGL